MNVAFVPLTTLADISFWSSINSKKLHEWKLDESPIECFAEYSIQDFTGSPSRLSFCHDSFENASSSRFHGFALAYNTIEGFQNVDRRKIIEESALSIFHNIKNGVWLERPEILNTFVLTIHANLKKFVYTYWNCVPALCSPENITYVQEPIELDTGATQQLLQYYRSHGYPSIFIHHKNLCLPLSHLMQMTTVDAAAAYLVVADGSTETRVPGWTIRNALAALSLSRPDINEYRLISLRASLPSLHYVITGTITDPSKFPKTVGWERSIRGKLEPITVDMKSHFDPHSLMEQSVDLNLSLIKWRLVPEMKLERFKALRTLIFGAGTLGCNLARSMLGWGVRHFTFIDNSNVSYSNPVRQSLSEFEDARLGKSKADCAASALKRILPTVYAQSVQMTVPMPGHSVGAQGEQELEIVVNQLEELVLQHDVLFLALDSREARWLPTVLANIHNKMAYSVALGFDTYVIIRHGVGESDVASTSESSVRGIVSYSNLACYFCSDVTAPGNSTTDRTLDQQCTVARAGISMIASGLATELLAAVLQHENPVEAPAIMGDLSAEDCGGLLGHAPHQIRGFIHRFQQMTPCVRRFDRCIACGKAVKEAFEAEKWRFVRDVMNSPSRLEEITGLDQLQASVDQVDIDFASEDDGSSVVSFT
ncbi:unnamed protein product, partial [Mesorhabditis belari]|uniref:Ubiquitin-like modifier-activating enzyme ATG7 n=1 Tax=Mesorhabditis belari TaxID=2138241 RepID=A0AAF3FF87_9BILA